MDGLKERKKKKKTWLRGTRKRRFRRTLFIVIILGLFITIVTAPLFIDPGEVPVNSIGPPEGEAHLFYNEACSGCKVYIDDELVPALKDAGLKVMMMDYVAEKSHRRHLNSLNELYGIPPQLLGHIATYINTGDLIFLMGHPPMHVVKDLVEGDGNRTLDKILILQDEMKDAVTYKAWGFKGDLKEYDIGTSISDYIDWFEVNKGTLVTPDFLKNPQDQDDWGLTGVVVVTGLLDGINPCAFAVLILFISFLYTIGRARMGIFAMGSIYILAIYTIYFLIGLSLLRAIHFFGIPHFMAIVGAILVIVLGFINLRDYLFPRLPVHLEVPYITRKKIVKWLHRATYPGALVAGILVGLCTFPCSGGIYVAIVGLLAAETSFTTGVMFLLLYNLMFVVPLIIMLGAASNPYAIEKIKRWEESKNKNLRIILGLVMIGLGIVILVWFV